MLFFLAAPVVASAGRLSVRVDGDVDRDSGALTLTSRMGTDARVEFGSVAMVGMPPKNGERFDLVDGGTHYVATFNLRVTDTDDVQRRALLPRSRVGRDIDFSTPDRSPSAMRRPGVAAPADRSARGGIYIAPEGEPVALTVDVYARLVETVGSNATVAVSQGDATDWSVPGSGSELGLVDVLIATDVPVGDALTCQVALHVPRGTLGQLGAAVAFSARPRRTEQVIRDDTLSLPERPGRRPIR